MEKIRPKIGNVSVYVLSIIPIIIWLFLQSLPSRFGTSDAIYTSIGQISGLLGMTMFAITLILSGRFSFMEKYFGGLNNIYKIHHTLGGYSLILLILHPLVGPVIGPISPTVF